MNRFDGTAAPQLVFLDDADAPLAWRETAGPDSRGRNLRLLQKDIYAELTRRRRRAQIAARRHLEE
jgi:hypothetical protein